MASVSAFLLIFHKMFDLMDEGRHNRNVRVDVFGLSLTTTTASPARLRHGVYLIYIFALKYHALLPTFCICTYVGIYSSTVLNISYSLQV